MWMCIFRLSLKGAVEANLSLFFSPSLPPPAYQCFPIKLGHPGLCECKAFYYLKDVEPQNQSAEAETKHLEQATVKLSLTPEFLRVFEDIT